MHEITVFAKDGCHLCERAIEVLGSLSAKYDFELRVLDITKDEKLHEKYWISIPVVSLDGKDIFEAEDIATPEDCMVKLEQLASSLSIET